MSEHQGEGIEGRPAAEPTLRPYRALTLLVAICLTAGYLVGRFSAPGGAGKEQWTLPEEFVVLEAQAEAKRIIEARRLEAERKQQEAAEAKHNENERRDSAELESARIAEANRLDVERKLKEVQEVNRREDQRRAAGETNAGRDSGAQRSAAERKDGPDGPPRTATRDYRALRDYMLNR
jgi:hypothetical protein